MATADNRSKGISRQAINLLFPKSSLSKTVRIYLIAVLPGLTAASSVKWA